MIQLLYHMMRVLIFKSNRFNLLLTGSNTLVLFKTSPPSSASSCCCWGTLAWYLWFSYCCHLGAPHRYSSPPCATTDHILKVTSLIQPFLFLNLFFSVTHNVFPFVSLSLIKSLLPLFYVSIPFSIPLTVLFPLSLSILVYLSRRVSPSVFLSRPLYCLTSVSFKLLIKVNLFVKCN